MLFVLLILTYTPTINVLVSLCFWFLRILLFLVDVKLWQTFALISELERIVIPRDTPVILCGDFNSEPDSAVYELISHGSITQSHPELQAASRGHESILPDLHNITHTLDLTSMMATVNNGNEPAFTNFTGKFKGWFIRPLLAMIGLRFF